MTKKRLDRLRRLAVAAKKAAGGGKWMRWRGHACVGALDYPACANNPGLFSGPIIVHCEDRDGDDNTPGAHNIARFVAAADPNTVLALLCERDRLADALVDAYAWLHTERNVAGRVGDDIDELIAKVEAALGGKKEAA